MLSAGGRAAGQEGFGLKGMIILSFLVHILLLLILIFSPSFPAPTLTFGPVYSVQLVSMPASMPQRKGADTSLKELMQIAPSSQPLIRKESASALPAVPIAPIETKKKSTENIDDVLEKIKKNVQTAAKTPKITKAPPPVAVPKGGEQITPALPGPPGRQSQGDANEKMSSYYALIWARIKGAWSLPQGTIPPGNIQAIIHARILRDGTVQNVSFEKKSGNRYFDESALRSVKKASPFPPLPEGLREESLEVGIRFHSAEFR